MQHISSDEDRSLRGFALGALCIEVIAHVPQRSGGCHPFTFMRGAIGGERTSDQVYERVKPDILQHISDTCGRSCECDKGKPEIRLRRIG